MVDLPKKSLAPRMQWTDDKVKHIDGHRWNIRDADELMELENENMKRQNKRMALQLEL